MNTAIAFFSHHRRQRLAALAAMPKAPEPPDPMAVLVEENAALKRRVQELEALLATEAKPEGARVHIDAPQVLSPQPSRRGSGR